LGTGQIRTRTIPNLKERQEIDVSHESGPGPRIVDTELIGQIGSRAVQNI
jgi:hypothetical protein